MNSGLLQGCRAPGDKPLDLPFLTDLTGLNTDYPLRIGESAVLYYKSATTLPLNIEVPVDEWAEYQMILSGDRSVATSSNGPIQLLPNNVVTATNAVRMHKQYLLYGGNPAAYTATQNYFYIAEGVVHHAVTHISTYRKAKALFSRIAVAFTGPAYYQMDATSAWEDYTTLWKSLGTLIIPFAQSGRVLIRRLC
jgi:hypothetical protein